MLARKWSLHDVEDVESVCGHVAGKYLAKNSASLGHSDREDLEAYLLAEAWKCDQRFDPSKGVPFSAYLRRTLGARCVDWYRSRYGRTVWKWRDHEYRRDRTVPLSLDATTSDSGGTLADSLTGDAGDYEGNGGADLMRLLAGGGGTDTEDQKFIRRLDARDRADRASTTSRRPQTSYGRSVAGSDSWNSRSGP